MVATPEEAEWRRRGYQEVKLMDVYRLGDGRKRWGSGERIQLPAL